MSKNTDDKVESKITGTNQRVNDLSTFASEVLQAAHDSMEIMQTQHKDSIMKADQRTDSRSRFQEMCALSKMRGDLKMSPKEYEDAKMNLMKTWQRQWTPSTRPGSSPFSKSMPPFMGASPDFFTQGSTPLESTLLP